MFKKLTLIFLIVGIVPEDAQPTTSSFQETVVKYTDKLREYERSEEPKVKEALELEIKELSEKMLELAPEDVHLHAEFMRHQLADPKHDALAIKVGFQAFQTYFHNFWDQRIQQNLEHVRDNEEFRSFLEENSQKIKIIFMELISVYKRIAHEYFPDEESFQ